MSNVTQEGLSGEDDSIVLKAATKEGRVVLTFDLDFADIRKYPLGTHSGIAVFRLHDQRWQTLEGPVRRLLAEGNLDRLQRGLAIVDESRVRFRRFPRKNRP